MDDPELEEWDAEFFAHDGVRIHTYLCAKTRPKLLKEKGKGVEYAFLITHPHTLLGGSASMMTPLAKMLAVTTNGPVMRVDTRGAGRSAGWGSIGARPEIMDVSAACRWLHEELGVKSVHLVGYSTGAAVSSSVLDEYDFVRGLVAIAYPFGGWWGMLAFASQCALGSHFKAVQKSTKPVVFITGDHDEITSVARTKEYFNEAAEPKSLHILEGAGHFSILGGRTVKTVLHIIGRYLDQQPKWQQIIRPVSHDGGSASGGTLVEYNNAQRDTDGVNPVCGICTL